MKKYVCMFNDRTLANEVDGLAKDRGCETMVKPITWNRTDGSIAVTYGLLAQEFERTRVLDLIADHQLCHYDLLKCPTCSRPTLEPLSRYGRGRVSASLRRVEKQRRRRRRPIFCRYCRSELRVGEVLKSNRNQ